MRRRDRWLFQFLYSALVCALFSCNAIVLTSCNPHGSPEGSILLPAPLPDGPRALHFVPFFDFKGGADGASPLASIGGAAALIGNPAVALYGVTYAGGNLRCSGYGGKKTGCGVAYVLTPAPSKSGLYHETVLHTFSGRDGNSPLASLLQIGSSLYGTTAYGGFNASCPIRVGCGTAFELTRSGSSYSEMVLHSFGGGRDGIQPEAPLTADAGGNLYGTTAYGGGGVRCNYGGCGTVFELERSESSYRYRVIYRFAESRPLVAYAFAGVLILKDGSLLGTTNIGGAAGGSECSAFGGCGTVFELVPAGGGSYKFSIVHAFSGGSDGVFPQSGLAQDASGVLFGATNGGGGSDAKFCARLRGCGTLYSLTPMGAGRYAERVVHAFVPAEGWAPIVAPAIHDGELYGVALFGGGGGGSHCLKQYLDGCGVVFSVRPSGASYRVLYRFDGNGVGGYPEAPLYARDDALYGTTADGGTFGLGTAFKFTP